MDIDIWRFHEIVKSKISANMRYFGEVSESGQPAGIGLIARKNGEDIEYYRMYENIQNGSLGNGMTITYDIKNAAYGMGMSKNNVSVGPQISFWGKNPLYCYNLNEKGFLEGFSIRADFNGDYTIRWNNGDGTSSYRELYFTEGKLHFVDARRYKDDKKVAWEPGEKYAFKYGIMNLCAYNPKLEVIPAVQTKNGPTSFTFSGGIQIAEGFGSSKYKYNHETKNIEFPMTIPEGLGIKYFNDGGHYFGMFDHYDRHGCGCCYRPDGTRVMGQWYKDVTYNASLVVYDDKHYALNSYTGNRERTGVCFDFQHGNLTIYYYDHEEKSPVHCNISKETLDLVLHDENGNTLKKYPFSEFDAESLSQLEEKIEKEQEEIRNPEQFPRIELSTEDIESLAYFEYLDYEPHLILTGFVSEYVGRMDLPRCSRIIADGAFSTKNKKLNIVHIANFILDIGERAFENAKNLYELNFSVDCKIKDIKKRTFAGTSIKHVSIHDSVKRIGPEAFADCKYLSTAFVPDDCEVDPTAFPAHCTISTSSEVHARNEMDRKSKKNPFLKLYYKLNKNKYKKNAKYAYRNPETLHDSNKVIEEERNKNKKTDDKNVKASKPQKSVSKPSKPPKPRKPKKKWHMPKLSLPCISFDWLGNFSKWFWISLLIVGAFAAVQLYLIFGGEITPVDFNFFNLLNDPGYVCRWLIDLYEMMSLPLLFQILMSLLFIVFFVIGFVLDIVLVILILVVGVVLLIVLSLLFIVLNLAVFIVPVAFMVLRIIFAFRDDVTLAEKVATIVLLVLAIAMSSWFVVDYYVLGM